MFNIKCIICFILFTSTLKAVKSIENCDFTYALKDGVLSLKYLNIEVPKNDDNSCINPITAGTENEIYGRVYKIITSSVQNLVPILYRLTVANFPHLVEIQMQKLGIKVIKTAAFHNLFELEVLNLESNSIEEIEEYALQSTPEINTIHLQKNRLRSINVNWINGISRLKVLNVSYNSIDNIDDGFKNMDVQILDISHNFLSTVKRNVFNELKSLKILNLGYNFIHQIENNAFGSTKNLHALNLYSNNLTYITTDSLNSWVPLHELILLYNPIPCVCLQDTAKWLARTGINLNKMIRCATDIENIPICVETNEMTCSSSDKYDLYTRLHWKNTDHQCYLPIEIV